MAVGKYLANTTGTITEVAANQTSAGAGDANKLVALNSSGLIDTTMMPVGVGADTASILASEALSAGAFVNVFNNSGTANCRNANASTSGKEAHGFVLSSVLISTSALVYFNGTDNAVTGATPGVQFLSTTPGVATTTAPSASGNVVQRIGEATSATSINFTTQPPIVLA